MAFAVSFQSANALLRAHRDALDRVAEALIDREKLDQKEFESIVDPGASISLEKPGESDATGDDQQP